MSAPSLLESVAAYAFLRLLVASGEALLSVLDADEKLSVRLLHERRLVEFVGPRVVPSYSGWAALEIAEAAAAEALVGLPVHEGV